MKNKIILSIAIAFSLVACNTGNEYTEQYLLDALVTVKDNNGKLYLQVNDTLAVVPTNVTTNPYKKEVRALSRLLIQGADPLVNGREVQIVYLDSLFTKNIVPSVADNDAEYGNDAIDIIEDWLTVAEDGYLCLHFTSLSAKGNGTHYLNLVKGENASNPYELVFRHKCELDPHGEKLEGLMAFRLHDFLPDNGETVALTIRYEATSGPKTFTMKARKPVQ